MDDPSVRTRCTGRTPFNNLQRPGVKGLEALHLGIEVQEHTQFTLVFMYHKFQYGPCIIRVLSISLSTRHGHFLRVKSGGQDLIIILREKVRVITGTHLLIKISVGHTLFNDNKKSSVYVPELKCANSMII